MLKVLARGPGSPVITEDVIAVAPKDAAGILAFDRRTGELRWHRELVDARYLCGICDGRLIAADNHTLALDLKTGRTDWEYFDAGKTVLGQPGFSGNVLYLPREDGIARVDAVRTGAGIEQDGAGPALRGAAGEFDPSAKNKSSAANSNGLGELKTK